MNGASFKTSWIHIVFQVIFLNITLAVFVSSVVMYSSLPGVDVAHKLHWTPGETVSHSAFTFVPCSVTCYVV